MSRHQPLSRRLAVGDKKRIRKWRGASPLLLLLPLCFYYSYSSYPPASPVPLLVLLLLLLLSCFSYSRFSCSPASPTLTPHVLLLLPLLFLLSPAYPTSASPLPCFSYLCFSCPLLLLLIFLPPAYYTHDQLIILPP